MSRADGTKSRADGNAQKMYTGDRQWWPPCPEPAYVRAADLVILFYIYGWWSIGLRVNAALPKMHTSLNNHGITHVDIDHQNGASKIILMMTSGEMGQ